MKHGKLQRRWATAVPFAVCLVCWIGMAAGQAPVRPPFEASLGDLVGGSMGVAFPEMVGGPVAFGMDQGYPPAGTPGAYGGFGVVSSYPGPAGVSVATAISGAIQGGLWWIGIQCRAVDPPLREQLGLEEGVGLLVEEVVPDKPASKAGLKRFDVLIAAGDRELRSVQDLIDVINQAEGKEIKLKYIRRGETLETSVVPEKRPPQPHIELPPIWGERWPFRFRFYYPGQVVPPQPGKFPPLPENVTITITKKGDEPAQIKVQRGSESWEVSEKELDKLPKDIRPHVEQMLRGVARGPEPESQQPWGIPSLEFFWPTPPWWSPSTDQAIRERIERQLQELNRRMEELRERVEELKKRVPGGQPPGRPRGAPQPQPPGETT